MNKRMGLLGGFILMMFVSSAQASNEDDAHKAFADATIKQLGIDSMVTEWVKRQVPTRYLKLAEQVAPVVEAASTGTIKLVWEIK